MSKFFSRRVDGVLVLDKPHGLSSNEALQRVRKLFRAQKAGHTGSLDPLATGVLPLCFGEATKFSQYLLESDKGYSVKAKLGVSTDTGDAAGVVISEEQLPTFSEAQINETLASFHGQYAQVPPMYSALKQQGVPLYRLARQGLEVERKPRLVTIHQIKLLDFSPPFVSFDVLVSKGTYIRSLVEDIAAKLGVGGHVEMLRRTSAGGFHLTNTVTLSELEDIAADAGFPGVEACLDSPSSLVADWPTACISQADADRLVKGQAVATLKPVDEGLVRVFSELQCFLGMGLVLPDGRVAPKRLVNM